MAKVTFETDGAKNEMSGKCIFAVVIDPENEADIAAVLIGTTSPYDLIDAIGKGTGAQIAKICPDFKSKLKLIEVLGESTAKGVFGTLKTEEIDYLFASDEKEGAKE